LVVVAAIAFFPVVADVAVGLAAELAAANVGMWSLARLATLAGALKGAVEVGSKLSELLGRPLQLQPAFAGLVRP
jgi:hypothetical protein